MKPEMLWSLVRQSKGYPGPTQRPSHLQGTQEKLGVANPHRQHQLSNRGLESELGAGNAAQEEGLPGFDPQHLK
jgi:hypothetical protein